MAATVGSLKMIVLEDKGNNRIQNTNIMTRINNKEVTVCTTNGTGICFAVAPFGNNTFIVKDKNANDAERTQVIDF